MKAIAAMGENRAIGYLNKIPWYIKDDFKWFKEFTLNKVLVVGSNTYLSLPTLTRRKLLVISRGRNNENFWNPRLDYAVYCTNKETTIELDEKTYGGEVVVIGGAKTYELFLPNITEFYVTHVKGTYPADVFMPAFEHLFSKREIVKEFDGHKVVKYIK